VRHRKIAIDTGIPAENALLAVNGDILELDSKRFEFVGHFEENRVFIEGEGGSDVSKVVIKDRRKIAETGIVFCVVIRNSVSAKIMAGPQILTRGMFEEGGEGDLIERAQEVVMALTRDYAKSGKIHATDLQEELRIGLRRYFHSRIGKKPVVMPILVDV
jgi:ribonuclease J